MCVFLYRPSLKRCRHRNSGSVWQTVYMLCRKQKRSTEHNKKQTVKIIGAYKQTRVPPDGDTLVFMSCSGQKVVFVKSSMLVVRITKNPCKSWHIAAYLGILYPVQRLPWHTNKTLCIQIPRFRGDIIT